jgi:hypothetical protein
MAAWGRLAQPVASRYGETFSAREAEAEKGQPHGAHS